LAITSAVQGNYQNGKKGKNLKADKGRKILILAKAKVPLNIRVLLHILSDRPEPP